MLRNVLFLAAALFPLFLLAAAFYAWRRDKRCYATAAAGGFFLYLTVFGSFTLASGHFGRIGAIGDFGLNLPTAFVGACAVGGVAGLVYGVVRFPLHWSWRILAGVAVALLIPVVAAIGFFGVTTAHAIASTSWNAGPYTTWKADSTLQVREFCPDREQGMVSDTTLSERPLQLSSLCNLQTVRKISVRARATPPDSFPMPNRLFVVGDVHGHLDQAANMLQRHGVIDKDLRWTWGGGHLVFLGDVMDRGTQVDRALWLVYRLQQEARKAGGQVTFVLGNHERMVLSGDTRYVSSKDALAANYLGTSYGQLFGPNTIRGQWLRRRNAVVQIGSILLAHGGLHPKVAERYPSISAINGGVQAVLDVSEDSLPAHSSSDLLTGERGPLWYRGYFQSETEADTLLYEKAMQSEVDSLLSHFGAERIVVAHTTVPQVHSRYQGRVIAADVEFSGDDDWFTSDLSGMSLLVKDDTLLRAHPDGSTTPVTSEAGTYPPQELKLEGPGFVPWWVPDSLRP